ncbi:hypothetical protein [Bacteriovorax sp. DB6_IX]|uniref:hypothetical protein n=1 Tax=Bacteriovorax sp. DB6_IX TaxID=1353530 RepID=UPI00038A1BAA|nr:hypothetical protein [Bacteriovorax sp. DB6_IX]EQC51341.1 hypothetical protein M901_0170 [Bacteriovorax sp. DB6_IX]
MILVKNFSEYDLYILNSEIKIEESGTYISQGIHFLMMIVATLRLKKLAIICESENIDIDLVCAKKSHLHENTNYFTLNYSLKNKVSDLPNPSDIKSLLNLKTYFKTHL